MKVPPTIIAFVLMAFLVFQDIPAARAMRPLYSPFAVVAGSQYTAGFKDGSFSAARFNRPLGLTLSEDGTQLFVADSLNNRIRIVHLDQNNEVGTLCGQDKAGAADGPVPQAQFNDPRGVLSLPGGLLAVNDFGNQFLRFVDLKTGAVSTYRGGPSRPGGSDASKPNASPSPVALKGIKDMAYLPATHSILFTQPEEGVLKALNLDTGQITTALKDNAQIPHPSALWIQENKIYAADRDLKSVFSMDWKNNTVANIQPAGTPVDNVLSLCSSDGTLYGLLGRKGFPAQRFLLDKRYSRCDESNGVVKFNNGWGDFVPPDRYPDETVELYSPWMGFVPDPSGDRQFFYALPNLNIIVSLHDLYWSEPCNNMGLSSNAEYPAKKPKNTYRMMLLGDCRVTDTDDFIYPTDTHVTVTGKTSVEPTNLSISPQVEHELNFQAALDDNPIHYEFLNAGHHGDMIFWPTTEVPDKVKKLDVDLVILFSPALDRPAYWYYFMYNLTPDGIPQAPPDPEYVLKPPQERIPDGLPRKFYDYCKAHNLVKIEGNNFVWGDGIDQDPNLRDMLLEFWAKPWEVLQSKLSNITTSSGKHPKLLILFGYLGSQSGDNYHPERFKEIARKCQIPYFDMNPYLNAYYLSYYPMTGPGHLDPNGAIFFGKILARMLPKEGLIPWPTPEKTPSK